MKKYLSIFVAVTCIATIGFFPTNTVSNTKSLAGDPPVLTFPPPHVTDQNTESVMNDLSIVSLTTTTAV